MATRSSPSSNARRRSSVDASGAAGCEPAAGFCGEGYTDAGEPSFVSAAEQPLSTLSADADTASYANLRRSPRANRPHPPSAAQRRLRWRRCC
ncbi:VWA domain-containing protein [Adlercreutzia equolifaciens]|uniref:VWA domain-containing protein n=1 Tax=Adlercreutzia equolifaciens TaxID=446660 RepID=UPI003AB146C9